MWDVALWPSPPDATLIMTEFPHQPPFWPRSPWRHSDIMTSQGCHQLPRGPLQGSEVPIGAQRGPRKGIFPGSVSGRIRKGKIPIRREIKVSPIRLIRHHCFSESRLSSKDEILYEKFWEVRTIEIIKIPKLKIHCEGSRSKPVD